MRWVNKPKKSQGITQPNHLGRQRAVAFLVTNLPRRNALSEALVSSAVVEWKMLKTLHQSRPLWSGWSSEMPINLSNSLPRQAGRTPDDDRTHSSRRRCPVTDGSGQRGIDLFCGVAANLPASLTGRYFLVERQFRETSGCIEYWKINTEEKSSPQCDLFASKNAWFGNSQWNFSANNRSFKKCKFSSNFRSLAINYLFVGMSSSGWQLQAFSREFRMRMVSLEIKLNGKLVGIQQNSFYLGNFKNW